MEPDLVARPLVVEGETGAVMADLDQPFAPRPASRTGAGIAAGAAASRSQTAGRSGFSKKVAVRSISINS